jgi:quercetin dioxygenase-like cupin family protein
VTLFLIAIVSVLALALVAPAFAQTETAEPAATTATAEPTRASDPDSAALRSAWSPRERALRVHHGPVEVVLGDSSSDGHQVGDVRVTSVATTNADGGELGRLDATLTTTGIDAPAIGDESRIGVLVFSFGDSGSDQITVEGSAHYPAQGATIATGESAVRPILGGSGRLAGATGSAVTEHLDDGSWVHTLTLQNPRTQRVLDQAAREQVRERLEVWRAKRSEAQAERKGPQAQRKEARVERKAEVAESKAERKTARAQTKATRDAERAAATAQRKTARTEARETREADRKRRVTAADLYAATADETGVIRTDLGIAEPGSAAGQELGLWHYSITAGEELAPHTHPGWQLARVTAGDLEYTVLSGEGVLLRADGSSEAMGPGAYLLAPGDGVIENPELEHYGANRGEDLVTIIAATLYPAGEPLATVIEEVPAD